ncbi:hypothetical protein R1sor_021191 [Riccia sorocarpa]|uniref:Methyltransferase domain-containing protein n=1 Tax=Riccia sorocarpa TaxID=122646 RepID=A0ABD3GJQ4_9MARC
MATNEEDDRLPSFHEIVKRFSLFSAAATCNPQVGPGGSLRCRCQGCTDWYAFVEGCSPLSKEVQYEVLTEEHVHGLANYLLLQAAEYRLPVMKVLEVGAGSGRLNFHLNRLLNRLSRDSKDFVVHVTASDNGERGLNGPNVNVEDAVKAISQENPHLVMVSWMPMGVDWTASMRATDSVLEYILIGEMDDGICGDPWLTWGSRFPGDESSSDTSSHDNGCLNSKLTYELHESRSCSNYGPGKAAVMIETENPSGDKESGDESSSQSIDGISTQPLRPYEADGWVRIELEHLSKFQICRTDERWSTYRHSHTVSFRRLPMN